MRNVVCIQEVLVWLGHSRYESSKDYSYDCDEAACIVLCNMLCEVTALIVSLVLAFMLKLFCYLQNKSVS